MIYKYDLNTRLGDYTQDRNRIYGDYRSEKDKLVIISLRENLNPKYYDYHSIKPEDDYKISVPRRVAKFEARLLGNKMRMLYKQLKNSKRKMFKDNKYVLKITYNSFFLTEKENNEQGLFLSISYKELKGREKQICKIIESFVHYFYKSIIDIKQIPELSEQLSKISIKDKTFSTFKKYYLEIIKYIAHSYFTETDEDGLNHVISCFEEMAEELSINTTIKFEKDYFWFELDSTTNIDLLTRIVTVTIDEKVNSDLNEMFTVFGRFFDSSIENLSDGENAYLGFYASLYEQISFLTPNKEKYIILLDEPESRMHPELTRNFVNDLILFLNDLCDNKKKFQIIISTHAPFILSDIKSDNIIYLEKNSQGNCESLPKNLKTFGANIHSLFKDGFFMDTTIGEFATLKIKEIINKIENGSCDSNIIQEINIIGEPLIKNRLTKLYYDKYENPYNYLQSENEKLRKRLKELEGTEK